MIVSCPPVTANGPPNVPPVMVSVPAPYFSLRPVPVRLSPPDEAAVVTFMANVPSSDTTARSGMPGYVTRPAPVFLNL